MNLRIFSVCFEVLAVLNRRVALTAFIAVCDSARDLSDCLAHQAPRSGVVNPNAAPLRGASCVCSFTNRALSHTAINAVSATRLVSCLVKKT